MADNWIALTSCFFPSRKPIKLLEVSAEIQHVPLTIYGKDEQYSNWTRMKVHRMIPALEDLKTQGYSHVLYTDGRDAFFTAPFGQILEQYRLMGAPDAVLSGQHEPFTMGDKAPNYDFMKPDKYRFHCCGGYLGLIDYWIETHKRFIQDDYESRPTGGDEAGVWQWAWHDGWFRPKIDSKCQIFMNLGGCGTDIEIKQEVVRNLVTKTYPCLLHFNGCCKDQVYGVYDDMKPYWDAIYPNHPISKEEIAV